LILVDSSVWIDYCNGARTPQTEVLDVGQELLVIGDLILAEVLQGFDDDRDFATARRLLTSLSVIEIGGIDIAIAAAQNYRALRKRGITVRKTIDATIATRCMAKGYDLLHSDRDFEPFVKYLGLRVAG
jgi:predicted nucleic acid-binding protein